MLDVISAIELATSASLVVVVTAWTLGAALRERMAIGAGLAAWFVGVVALGATHALDPSRGLGPPGLALAVVLPVVVLAALAFATQRGRARVAAVSLPPLIAVQAVRVLGVSFVLLYAAGRLPAPFAPTAGWGDITVGVLALPAAWIAATGRGPRMSLLAWNALGVLDLLTAVFLGATSSPGALRLFFAEPGSALMTTLPWLLIPGFLVPLLLVLHLIVFSRLRVAGRERAMPASLLAS